VLAGVLALAGCQSVDEGSAASPSSGPSDTGTAEDSGAAAESGTAYPDLHTVPPRPQLSYTVQQRRAIVDGLIGDRENALYTDQVVRYRAGLSTLPPPPQPPSVTAAIEPSPEAAGATAAPAPQARAGLTSSGAGGQAQSGDQSPRNETEKGSLGEFVDRLDRATTPTEPDASAQGVTSGGPQGSDGGSEDASSKSSGWFGWFRNLFQGRDSQPAGSAAATGSAAPMAAVDGAVDPATAPALRPAMAADRLVGEGDRSADNSPLVVAETAGPTEPQPVPAAGPPAPSPAPPRPDPGGAGIEVGEGTVAVHVTRPVARASPTFMLVLFQPGSAALPPLVNRRLEQAVAAAKARGARIRIEGEADDPALALDRARAVGLALVRLGAPAGDLEMTLARKATGDQARLILAAPVSP
jgi:hypothetical protein